MIISEKEKNRNYVDITGGNRLLASGNKLFVLVLFLIGVFQKELS